jgi:hypothetical protein
MSRSSNPIRNLLRRFVIAVSPGRLEYFLIVLKLSSFLEADHTGGF